MARTELNVIQFTKYNQAIYPHDYYIEVESDTAGKLTVVEKNAGSNQINYNDDALIGIDGLPLFSAFDKQATHYVLKVEGFLKEPDAETLQFEFKMEKPDDKYVLVVENTATVPIYYVETASGDDDGALEVVNNVAGDGEINYQDVIKADGTKMYDSFKSGEYVKAVSGDKQITILKGNSIQGILDQTYDLRHGGTYYIRLESGRFKNTYGSDKGKVVLETTDTLVKAAVLCFK
jgi:hypothetical protein